MKIVRTAHHHVFAECRLLSLLARIRMLRCTSAPLDGLLDVWCMQVRMS